MSESQRCQRRKQTNPRRKSVLCSEIMDTSVEEDRKSNLGDHTSASPGNSDGAETEEVMDPHQEESEESGSQQGSRGASVNLDRHVQTRGADHRHHSLPFFDHTWNRLQKVSEMQANIKDLDTQSEGQQVALLSSFRDSLTRIRPGTRCFDGHMNQKEDFLLVSCQFCNQTFAGPILLHQHQRYLCSRNQQVSAPHQAPASVDLTSPVHVFEDQTAQLKTCCGVKTEDLLRVSTVALIPDFLKDWFSQRETERDNDKIHSPAVDPLSRFAHGKRYWQPPGDGPPDSQLNKSPSSLDLSPLFSINSQTEFLNVKSSVLEDRDGPLDLSLPRGLGVQPAALSLDIMEDKPHKPALYLLERRSGQGSGPSDLANLMKEVTGVEDRAPSDFGWNTFPSSSSSPYFPTPAQAAFALPTFMLPPQSSIPGLRLVPGLDDISFFPHVVYTYATGSAPLHDTHQKSKNLEKPIFQKEFPGGTSASLSMDFLPELHPLTNVKQRKKGENGSFACDTCDKTFQKMSSLLRHKYEHTGKRPHQCQVCTKAFKHKHHLIEHSRLHSGEKPYQCDKCGKRFSHSGSYSQHMNHRYSYCRRETQTCYQEERESVKLQKK